MSAHTSLGPAVHATIHDAHDRYPGDILDDTDNLPDGPKPRTCRQRRHVGGCQRLRRTEVQTEPRTPATFNTQSDRPRHDEQSRTPGDRRTQLRPHNSHGLISHPGGARSGHPESTNTSWRSFGRVAGLSKLRTTMRHCSPPSPPQSDFLHASFDQSHRSFSRASVRVPACSSERYRAVIKGLEHRVKSSNNPLHCNGFPR